MAFLLFLLPLSALLLSLVLFKKRNPKGKLPPSPWKLPLIGNMHNLLGEVPHRALRKLSQKYGSIMHLKLGQVDHIIISSPEAAREILKTHDITFATRPQLIATTLMFNGRNIIFAPYGSYWRHLRKICVLELLSASRVRSYRPIREGENASFASSIMHMSAGKPVLINLTEKLLLLTNSMTSRAAFGAECKHATKFILEMKKVLELWSGFDLLDLYPSLKFLSGVLGINSKVERIRKQLDVIMDEIIEEHQKKKVVLDNSGHKEEEQEEEAPKDVVDVLLSLKDEGGDDFPHAHIKAVIFDMFMAGTESSSTTLTWAMAELMRHPEVMEKAQKEVREAAKNKGRIEDADVEKLYYIKLVIKETLRLHQPVPFLLRLCSESCNIEGYEIPAGTRIIINAWAMARDTGYWKEAESFRPERFEESSMEYIGENFYFLPFGAGRRVCPGIGFGLANVELVLAHLLFHFDWALPDENELDMTENLGPKRVAMFLIATPRFPVPC